jgi:2-succinyl-6-hydroxy-2,4-cyclohexadiene-1-carboxylate synthase
LKIKLSDVTLNFEEYKRNSSSNNYIFFLHGFTGSNKDWNELIPLINTDFNIIAVDLIGHGNSDSPEEVSFYSAESIVEQIHQLILTYTNQPVIISGYSMGGRAALSFASKYPDMIKGLILESTGAGIEDENLKNERAKQDEELTRFIEENTIEEFINYWMNIDLFNSQKSLPKEKLIKIKKSKLKNSKAGLANSMRGFGSGKMPSLFDDIKNIIAKTLLISGEFDTKYTAVSEKLVKIFPDAIHVVIKSAGHNTHLEQPGSFINVINDFLNRL